jgi:hypothetical protein
MEQRVANQAAHTLPTAGQGSRASDPELPPGWTRPTLDNLPRPTYWPATLAVGVVFALGGIVTSYLVSLVGVALVAIAIAGWVGELRHEHTN